MRTRLAESRFDRRTMLHATASGLVGLSIATPVGVMTPRMAQAAQTPFATLTTDQAATLEALAEFLSDAGPPTFRSG